MGGSSTRKTHLWQTIIMLRDKLRLYENKEAEGEVINNWRNSCLGSMVGVVRKAVSLTETGRCLR